MKNIRFVLAVIVIAGAVVLAGCTPESGKRQKVAEGGDAETAEPSPYFSGVEQTVGASPDGTVDVDLTQLSGTMVYAEVFSMMMEPEAYIGKTVKMRGQFAAYESEPENGAAGEYHTAVVIADATACCQQGIEFVWSGEHTAPDDYPAVGSEVTVTGVFETFDRDGYTYCRLISEEMEVN